MRRLNSFILVLGLLMANVALAVTSAPSSSPTVYGEDKISIVATAKDSHFSIRLKSNPTTGYSWFLREYDNNLIQPVKHVFEAPANKKLMGAPGYEVWTFRVKPAAFSVPQQTAIRFVYARPWEADDQSRQLVFRVTTQ